VISEECKCIKKEVEHGRTEGGGDSWYINQPSKGET
jgi:hypothetical protein